MVPTTLLPVLLWPRIPLTATAACLVSCQLWEGGAPITGTFVKSISLDYDNSCRSQEYLCTLDFIGISNGTINCSGKVERLLYNALFTKFKANTTLASSSPASMVLVMATSSPCRW